MTIQLKSDEERRPAADGVTTPDAPKGSRRKVPLQHPPTVVRRVPWTPGTSAAGPQPSKSGRR